MRRLLALTAMLGLLAFAPAAAPVPKAAKHPCTVKGTDQRDLLAGSDRKDKICARALGDYVHAGDGDDIVKGQGGKDTLVGGDGKDKIKGMAGKDRLFGVGDSRYDLIVGGGGFDRCYGDQGDDFKGCEEKRRGPGLKALVAMEQAFAGATSLGEEAQAVIQLLCEGQKPAPPPLCGR